MSKSQSDDVTVYIGFLPIATVLQLLATAAGFLAYLASLVVEKVGYR